MYRYYIYLEDGTLIESKHRYQSYSGANGALNGALSTMHPHRLASLVATGVQKIG
jgi:hypothetical protein